MSKAYSNIPDKTEYKNTTSLKFKEDVVNFFNDKSINNSLEIGTNHGWTTKILSSFSNKVYTVDHYTENTELAKKNNAESTNIEYFTENAYTTQIYRTFPKMDLVFIDCVHSYDAVLYDINVGLSLYDQTKKIYFLFDDYGHPESTGVKRAILKAIEEGLKLETYVGHEAGYQYNPSSTLIDHEGIILSYGE